MNFVKVSLPIASKESAPLSVLGNTLHTDAGIPVHCTFVISSEKILIKK